MGPEDRIVQQPPKGKGASLTVSYKLPRGSSAGHAPAPIRPAPLNAPPRGIAGLSPAFRPVAYWRLEGERIERNRFLRVTLRAS
jgi:hypothetical protein